MLRGVRADMLFPMTRLAQGNASELRGEALKVVILEVWRILDIKR